MFNINYAYKVFNVIRLVIFYEIFNLFFFFNFPYNITHFQCIWHNDKETKPTDIGLKTASKVTGWKYIL